MEFNLHSAVSSCVTNSSCVAIPHCVGMSLYGAFLLVLASLLQGAFSQLETKTHMYDEKVRHKIASRDGRASTVGAHCAVSGSPCLREIDRMAWCAHCGRLGARKIQIIIRWLGTGQVVKFAGQVVKFEWLKVKFG